MIIVKLLRAGALILMIAAALLAAQVKTEVHHEPSITGCGIEPED